MQEGWVMLTTNAACDGPMPVEELSGKGAKMCTLVEFIQF